MIAGSGYRLKLCLHPAAGRDHVTERRTDLTSICRMYDLHAGKHPLHRAEDYPTPEAVAQRCIEGLSAVREKTKGNSPAEIPDEASKPPFIQHGLPLRVRWECWGGLEATDQA